MAKPLDTDIGESFDIRTLPPDEELARLADIYYDLKALGEDDFAQHIADRYSKVLLTHWKNGG